MRIAETVTFGGSGLNRAAELRGDPAQQAALLADPEARVLPIWRGKPLITCEARDRLGWLAPDHTVLSGVTDLIFLGLDEAGPRFAADVSAWEPSEIDVAALAAFFDPSEQHHPALPQDHRYAELRGVMSRLCPREAELAAAAKALMSWHDSHRFCARCGQPSDMVMSGWQRTCGACGSHHFPRTDPVVIMLITRGNSVLLGRSHGWPEGMFSLLAGFVEPGETLEAAVRREVFEEAGVRVGAVRYLASQPWPFPASLMMGCQGEATSDEITVDPQEIESALWISKEEMLRVVAGQHPTIRQPRKGAIAHFLITNWLADRLD